MCVQAECMGHYHALSIHICFCLVSPVTYYPLLIFVPGQLNLQLYLMGETVQKGPLRDIQAF